MQAFLVLSVCSTMHTLSSNVQCMWHRSGSCWSR